MNRCALLAVLFCLCSPPLQAQFLWQYDELYLPNSRADVYQDSLWIETATFQKDGRLAFRNQWGRFAEVEAQGHKDDGEVLFSISYSTTLERLSIHYYPEETDTLERSLHYRCAVLDSALQARLLAHRTVHDLVSDPAICGCIDAPDTLEVGVRHLRYDADERLLHFYQTQQGDTIYYLHADYRPDGSHTNTMYQARDWLCGQEEYSSRWTREYDANDRWLSSERVCYDKDGEVSNRIRQTVSYDGAHIDTIRQADDNGHGWMAFQRGPDGLVEYHYLNQNLYGRLIDEQLFRYGYENHRIARFYRRYKFAHSKKVNEEQLTLQWTEEEPVKVPLPTCLEEK